MPEIIKNICVIGGAGFIGSHIVDELVSKGHKVLVLDNLSSGTLKNINKGAFFKKYDIRSKPHKLAKILKKWHISKVFHLAAEPYIPECYDRPQDFFEINANGTLNVLMACKEAKVEKILYYSTSEVYGTVEGKISETTPLNPQSTYAVSKLAGDRLAFTLFHEHKIPVVIVRQFNCYGERESHPYVIPEIISQVDKASNPGVLALGNINAKRDFMYVKDAAWIACSLIFLGIPGKVYNVGTGSSISIKEIAEKIINRQNKKIEIGLDPDRIRPFDVQKLEADTKKLEKLFKFKNALTSFDKGLDNTIKWFVDNGYKWDYEK